MNVVDMRSQMRRSSARQFMEPNMIDRRKKDRRRQCTENSRKENFKRIWLTPGERALIEDLYLLDDI
jgi:hypothetical protein